MLIRGRGEFQISPLEPGDNDDKRYEKAALLLLLLPASAPGLNLCLHSSSCSQVIIISILLFSIIMISCMMIEGIFIMIMMLLFYLISSILKHHQHGLHFVHHNDENMTIKEAQRKKHVQMKQAL